MNICIIGNSHAAALKKAVDAAPSPEGHSFDFFILPGALCPKVEMAGRRIQPVKPAKNNMTTVRTALQKGLSLRNFDLVVISACGMQAARTKSLGRPDSHPLACVRCAEWPPTGRVEEAATLVSVRAFQETVAAYIREHASIRTAFLLAEHFELPVVLQPWPAPARKLKNNPDWDLASRFGDNSAKAWRAFFKGQYLALQAIAAELGPRFTLLDYPLPEILDEGFMDDSFGHHKDAWHANADYGALVLQQIAARAS